MPAWSLPYILTFLEFRETDRTDCIVLVFRLIQFLFNKRLILFDRHQRIHTFDLLKLLLMKLTVLQILFTQHKDDRDEEEDGYNHEEGDQDCCEEADGED